MNKEEAIGVLTEEIEFWAKVISKFRKKSFWFREGLKRIEASRIAIESLRESMEGEDDE